MYMINKNRFLLCLNEDDEAVDVTSLDFSDQHLKAKPDLVYYGRVLEYIQQYSQAKDLIFYITWSVNKLPSYGKNVVVILIGDEWCRIPSYSHQVRAIFKAYGISPEFGFKNSHGQLQITLLNLLQATRITAIRVPGIVKRLLQSPQARSPIYPIPIGYFKQLDLPIKAIESRGIDVFFAGSVQHIQSAKLTLRGLLNGPKAASRRLMTQKAIDIRDKHPSLNIDLLDTGDFRGSKQAGEVVYSERMMNAKICLVPRGASLETFRFFEAMRYGCVVIHEHLPHRWFYQDAPAVCIDSWENLETVVLELLSDQHLLQQYHHRVLEWWERTCSETSVGRYISEILDETA